MKQMRTDYFISNHNLIHKDIGIFFIENKNVIPFQYVNPLLVAGKGYTYNQILKLDFLNCIIPIPIFSCKFVKKYNELLKGGITVLPM